MRRWGARVTRFVPKITGVLPMVSFIGKDMIGGAKFGDDPTQSNSINTCKLTLGREGVVSIDPIASGRLVASTLSFSLHVFSSPKRGYSSNERRILCLRLSGSAPFFRMEYENEGGWKRLYQIYSNMIQL